MWESSHINQNPSPELFGASSTNWKKHIGCLVLIKHVHHIYHVGEFLYFLLNKPKHLPFMLSLFTIFSRRNLHWGPMNHCRISMVEHGDGTVAELCSQTYMSCALLKQKHTTFGQLLFPFLKQPNWHPVMISLFLILVPQISIDRLACVGNNNG
jgi:hypothetical protein